MAAVAGAKTIGNQFRNEEVVERVTYDFAVDAGATGALDLFTAAADLIITGYNLVVKTAGTSGGSATLIVGVTGTTNAFLTTTQGAVANLTLGAVLGPLYTEGTPNTYPLPRKLASGEKILQTIGTAALTAGKFDHVIKYMKA